MEFADSEDFVLSQALDLFENYTTLECFDNANLTDDDVFLSQTLDSIEKDKLFSDLLSDSETSVVQDCYGNFEMDFKPDVKPLVETITEDDKGRFGASVSNSDLDELVQGQKSKNTDRNTRWAVNTFEAWRKSKSDTGELIPALDQLDINTHLSRFVVEVRKQNGDFFPPESLYHLVCGILRSLRDIGIADKNFLDDKNPNYARFRSVLDAQMKFLTKEGVGGKKREAQPVSEDDEIIMWEKVFGDKNAMTLQYTVFFYNCKFFGLRGFDEHRDLETSQFEFGSDSIGTFMIYTGKNSKTYNGGLKHRRIEPKIIKHYNNQQNILYYYEKYLGAVGEGSFYKRPLQGELRYSNQVVGVNKLKNFMKEICQLSGLEGRYTNHSGKKTCATTLYQQDVPEQEIMKRTGHRSVAGVRKYQKPNTSMLVDISNKLNPPKPSPNSLTVKTETVTQPSATVAQQMAGESPQNIIDEESKENENLSKMSTTGHNVYNNCIFKF